MYDKDKAVWVRIASLPAKRHAPSRLCCQFPELTEAGSPNHRVANKGLPTHFQHRSPVGGVSGNRMLSFQETDSTFDSFSST
jgi:hypothetical protein